MPGLAIFDLDHTLIDGDSETLWADFLVREGLMPNEFLERTHEYYQQYVAGRLNMQELLAFQLSYLRRVPLRTLEALQGRFLDVIIEPIVQPGTRPLLARHRDLGHLSLLITASSDFVTRPIARLLGIENLLAVELEVRNGMFTGRSPSTPSFREGKVLRLREWLEERTLIPDETWFYSDSRNDLPLLREVDHPIAVDPDSELSREARRRGWPVISLRS